MADRSRGDLFAAARPDDIAGRALLGVVGILVGWLRHDCRSEVALREIATMTTEVVAELDAHQGRHWRSS